MTDALTDARAAVGDAAVALVSAIARMRQAEPPVWHSDENGALTMGGESNGISADGDHMRLARAFIVQIATPRYDRRPPVEGVTYSDGMDEIKQDKVPRGFVPIWGGEAAVRILALDRDRLGSDVRPLDLAALLVHPGPGPAPGWRTGPTPVG